MDRLHHLFPGIISRVTQSASELSLLLFSITLGVGQLCWRLRAPKFDQSYGFAQLPPWGYDFRLSLQWGTALRESGLEGYLKLPNAWPPFATLFYLPLGLLNGDAPYYILVALLLVSLLLCVAVSLRQFYFTNANVMQFALWVVILWALLLASFPMVFAIERGNSDAIVAALAVLSLTALESSHGLLSVVALTLSAQLKIYPAILAVFFLLRRRYALLSMFVVLNAAALCILGIRALEHFVSSVNVQLAGSSSHFNHSLYSYITLKGLPESIGVSTGALTTFSSLVLIAIWAATCGFVWWKAPVRDGNTPMRLRPAEAGINGMAFVLMSLLPAISWDYKLIIHVVPLLLLAGATKASANVSWLALSATAAVGVCTGLLLLPNDGSPRTVELVVNFLFYAVYTWSSFKPGTCSADLAPA